MLKIFFTISLLLLVAAVVAAVLVFGDSPAMQAEESQRPPQPSEVSERPDEVRPDVVVEILADEFGETAIRSEGRFFGGVVKESGGRAPDYKALEDFLARKKSEFEPGDENRSFRVEIVSGEGIDLKHVLFVLKCAENAKIDNVLFNSAPGPLDKLYDMQKPGETPSKQK